LSQPRIITRTSIVVAFAAALLASLWLIQMAPAPALAQAPAICDQYPNLPQCEEDEGDEDEDDENQGPGAGSGDGPSAPDAAGALPFTGYPLTALILFMLALLAVGVATRAYLALRTRRGISKHLT
jgi:hypothetical protein